MLNTTLVYIIHCIRGSGMRTIGPTVTDPGFPVILRYRRIEFGTIFFRIVIIIIFGFSLFKNDLFTVPEQAAIVERNSCV